MRQGLAGAQQVRQVTRLCAEEATPYVGEALRRLRTEVGNQAAVLGFVGAPFTLASYIVEGGSSSKYTHIKRLAFSAPDVLHALLGKLADNIADYVRFQVRGSEPNPPLTLFSATIQSQLSPKRPHGAAPAASQIELTCTDTCSWAVWPGIAWAAASLLAKRP